MLRRTVLGLLAAGTTVGPAWAQDDWAKTIDAAKKIAASTMVATVVTA